jgi:hypothetical protein
MTRDDIIRMAVDAGIDYAFGAEIDRFAELVAAVEREACAKVCDEKHEARALSGHPREASTALRLSEAIRARSAK